MLSAQVKSDYWLSVDALPINPYYAWLTKPYVLSEAIQKTSGKSFSVEVLSQAYALLEIDEQVVHNSSEAYLREVFLMVENEPWVYARVSVSSDCREFVEKLLTLGDNPIGVNLLYNDVTLQRSDFQYRLYDNFTVGQSRYHLNFSGHTLWARRSIFTNQKTQLLVSEFFSPHIGPYCDKARQ